MDFTKRVSKLEGRERNQQGQQQALHKKNKGEKDEREREREGGRRESEGNKIVGECVIEEIKRGRSTGWKILANHLFFDVVFVDLRREEASSLIQDKQESTVLDNFACLFVCL